VLRWRIVTNLDGRNLCVVCLLWCMMASLHSRNFNMVSMKAV